ncbi:MAG: Calx-beta domain-containing protein [Gammaproteobacteria bacterium]
MPYSSLANGLCAAVLLLVAASAHAAPFAYISNENSNDVSVIDIATNIVTATVPVGLTPFGVAVNPSGSRVYVTNIDSNTVSVIDTATNTVVATVAVGTNPFGIAINPAGTVVYVANKTSDTVSVIDTATNTVTATLLVGTNPYGVAINPAGTFVYVTTLTSDDVKVIDTATNTVTATVPVGDTATGIAINPAGTRAYVANLSSNNMSVIDTATNTVTATLAVGINPAGVAVNSSGTIVYVANRGSSTVSVVDTASNTVVATVAVGSRPLGVAINPAGTRVYVAHESESGNVLVINTAINAVVDAVAVGNTPAALGLFIGPPPGALQLSATAYSVDESAGTALITVTRTGGSFGAVTADVVASNGTATSPGDFTATTQTVSFGDGDTTAKTVTINITDDLTDELDETVTLVLNNATGDATVGTAAATLTITDNDAPPPPLGVVAFSVARSIVAERAGYAVIAVTRTDTTGNATVNFATSDGTAISGADFTAASGVLSFVTGDAVEIITVPITRDAIQEFNERFTVVLSAAQGASLGTPSVHTVTIGISGGGGCSLSPGSNGAPDPSLPIMVLAAGLYLLRRRLGYKA